MYLSKSDLESKSDLGQPLLNYENLRQVDIIQKFLNSVKSSACALLRGMFVYKVRDSVHVFKHGCDVACDC